MWTSESFSEHGRPKTPCTTTTGAAAIITQSRIMMMMMMIITVVLYASPQQPANSADLFRCKLPAKGDSCKAFGLLTTSKVPGTRSARFSLSRQMMHAVVRTVTTSTMLCSRYMHILLIIGWLRWPSEACSRESWRLVGVTAIHITISNTCQQAFRSRTLLPACSSGPDRHRLACHVAQHARCPCKFVPFHTPP